MQFISEISDEIYKWEDQFEILEIFKKYYNHRAQENNSNSKINSNYFTVIPTDPSPVVIKQLDWDKIIDSTCLIV